MQTYELHHVLSAARHHNKENFLTTLNSALADWNPVNALFRSRKCQVGWQKVPFGLKGFVCF